MKKLLALLLFSATLSAENVTERPPFVKITVPQNTISDRFYFAERCLNDYFDLIRVKPKIDKIKLTKIIVSLRVDSCDPIIVEYFKR